jgi:uncharacterized protein involved in exopolysaccharide biosynthesis
MTEDTPVTEVPAEPVIDEAAAQRAKLDAQIKDQQAKEAAEHAKMMADMAERRKQEAEIAGPQDALLRSIRANCDAGRAALERATRKAQ